MRKLPDLRMLFFIGMILTLTVGFAQALISGSTPEIPTPTLNDPVVGWAVLAEKDDYDDPDMPDLLVDYIDIVRVRQVLEKSGWSPENIHDLREFDHKSLKAGLDWLEKNADENDIVFLYVSSHGSYLSDVVFWQVFFAEEWAQITSQRKLLMVDVCHAAKFTQAAANDPSPHLSIASVDRNELAWRGLEEEGLPIIGTVFTYYFTAAQNDLEADTDADGKVSVQEAARLAEGKQRSYFHDVIFVVPDFLEMYHVLGVFPEKDPTYPHVIMDDALGAPLFLTLNAHP